MRILYWSLLLVLLPTSCSTVQSVDSKFSRIDFRKIACKFTSLRNTIASRIADRDSIDAHAIECFILTTGDQDDDGDFFEIIVFQDSTTLNYYPDKHRDRFFQRKLLNEELLQFRTTCANSVTESLGNLTTPVDDGWWYDFWHATPKRIHTFHAHNPDHFVRPPDQVYIQIFRQFQSLLFNGPLNYKILPGIDVDDLRVEFANPEWYAIGVWVRGDERKVKLIPRSNSSVDWSKRPNKSPIMVEMTSDYGKSETDASEKSEDLDDLHYHIGIWRSFGPEGIGARISKPLKYAYETQFVKGLNNSVEALGEAYFDDKIAQSLSPSIYSVDQKLVGIRNGKINIYDLKKHSLTVPVKSKDYDGYQPLCFLPGTSSAIFVRISNDPRHFPWRSSSWDPILKVDANLCVITEHESSFQIFFQKLKLPPQSTGKIDEVWASWTDPDDLSELSTLIGRYDLNSLKFKGWATINGIRFNTNAIWVDALSNRVFLLSEGSVLSFPIPEDAKKDFK